MNYSILVNHGRVSVVVINTDSMIRVYDANLSRIVIAVSPLSKDPVRPLARLSLLW